jgi:ubiquinone/menaquinone biosynthesis C-methylase UbiE
MDFFQGNQRFKKEKIKILDVACGTGRYEVLFQKHFRDDFEMIGMDFAGGMLEQTRGKLASCHVYVEPFNPELVHIRLQRGISEKLPFAENEFHMVILGFGVPSYSRFNYSIPEAHRVLKEGGLGVFTVYNKDAAFNENLQRFSENLGDCPLASWIEFVPFRDEKKNGNPQGYYQLVPQGDKESAIKIQAFTMEEFQGILNRFSFRAVIMKTFPKLYTTTAVSEIKRRISIDDNQFRLVKKDEEYKPLTKSLPPFSWMLYQIDCEESNNGSHKGFYITAIAEKAG